MTYLTFFPIDIPNGIFLNGETYTIPSLLDQKIGLNTNTITLSDPNYGSIELSRSIGSLEFQWLSFIQQQAELQEFESNIKGKAAMHLGLSLIEVETFSQELEKLFVFMYKSMLNVQQVPQEILLPIQKKADVMALLGERIEEVQFNPLDLFGSIVVDMKEHYSYIDHRDIDDYSKDHDRVKGQLKSSFENGSLSLLVGKLHSLADILHDKGKNLFPRVDTDLISYFTDVLLDGKNGFLYTSWEEDKPVKIMIEDGEGEFVLNTQQGEQRYKIHAELLWSELAAGIEMLSRVAVTNNMDNFYVKGAQIKQVKPFFPMELINGSIDLVVDEDSYNGLHVVLEFPAYAVVDMSSPDYVYLFDPGKFTFDYIVNQKRELKLDSYTVSSMDDKPYYHFFVQNSICGFSSVIDGGLPLSHLVYENFHKAFAVLTDGYKQATLPLIPFFEVKQIFMDSTIKLHGQRFTRYTKREYIESLNRTLPIEQRIHIGDGRIK